jgi:hypothetical protein
MKFWEFCCTSLYASSVAVPGKRDDPIISPLHVSDSCSSYILSGSPDSSFSASFPFQLSISTIRDISSSSSSSSLSFLSLSTSLTFQLWSLLIRKRGHDFELSKSSFINLVYLFLTLNISNAQPLNNEQQQDQTLQPTNNQIDNNHKNHNNENIENTENRNTPQNTQDKKSSPPSSSNSKQSPEPEYKPSSLNSEKILGRMEEYRYAYAPFFHIFQFYFNCV